MKKILLFLILPCIYTVKTWATDWTDTNGVTWTFSQGDYYYDTKGVYDDSNRARHFYVITSASNFGSEVIIPETVYDGETPCTVEALGSGVFYNNKDILTSVTLPSTIKCLVSNTFEACSNLVTIVNLDKVECIMYGSAFKDCTNLTSVDLSGCNYIGNWAFQGCTKLSNIKLDNVSYIGSEVFDGCNSLTSVELPKIMDIASAAFDNCPNLSDITITSTDLAEIGHLAFTSIGIIKLMGTIPPKLDTSSAFSPLMVIKVPDEAVADYRSSGNWINIKSHVIGMSAQTDYDVIVSAQSEKSGIITSIGESNLGNVISLKLSGSINGYDVMVMRNKMDNLHYLDLTNANIVANDYQYYTGYHTEDNVLGAYSFYNLSKLIDVKLPNTITSIGDNAFLACVNLKNVEFQPGIVSIGSYAFCSCSSLVELELKSGLKSIGTAAFFGEPYTIDNVSVGGTPKFEEVTLPEGLESIGDYAFYKNDKLKQISFPSTLKELGEYAFQECKLLTTITLPTYLQEIKTNTFYGCTGLAEVHIPSTILSIGDHAFYGCSNLNDVYTYIAEPTQIDMNTFSIYETATLHVPATSYYNYYFDTEWSQFRSLQEFDAEYEYFYINKDFTIDEEKGIIKGEGEEVPDADLYPGSGLIVDTSNETQKLNELHIKMKGGECASVIAASNFEANKVYFDIDIEQARWYFFCFPFKVKKVNLEVPGDYVFRVYDPEERANGKTGWVNWIGDELVKGQGYIFHCSNSGTLSLCVEKEDMNWVAENRPESLTSAPTENKEDASWNFIGNPHTSYYDIDNTGYTQPITIWNGTGYEAVRPGDDEYCLSPFEGFFVQKSDNVSEMNFPAGDVATDGRYTKQQWKMNAKNRAEARRARGVDTERQIINLTLSDGQIIDKTRVVFNEKHTQEYEMTCDASKFITSDVTQFYSLENKDIKYAINERSAGEVRLGYIATKEGQMTISSTRMDQPVLLHDNLMKITHDLAQGDYIFSSEAGTYNDRFVLLLNKGTTNIGQISQQTGVNVIVENGGIYFNGIDRQDVNIYSLSGALLVEHVINGFVQLPQAAYVVKVGNKSCKIIVR